MLAVYLEMDLISAQNVKIMQIWMKVKIIVIKNLLVLAIVKMDIISQMMVMVNVLIVIVHVKLVNTQQPIA